LTAFIFDLIIIISIFGGLLNMAKKGKDYFGLPWIISVILAFFIGPVMGILARFSEGKIIAGLLRLFFGWNIVWVLDFILILFTGKILRVINC
jgi:hypothetical protein